MNEAKLMCLWPCCIGALSKQFFLVAKATLESQMPDRHQNPSNPKYQIYLSYISDLSYSYDYQVDQFCKIARNYRHQVKSAKKYLMLSRVKEKAQFPSCPILDCMHLYFHTLLSGILFLCQSFFIIILSLWMNVS